MPSVERGLPEQCELDESAICSEESIEHQEWLRRQGWVSVEFKPDEAVRFGETLNELVRGHYPLPAGMRASALLWSWFGSAFHGLRASFQDSSKLSVAPHLVLAIRD